MNTNIIGKVGKFNIGVRDALFSSHSGIVLLHEFIKSLDFAQLIDANLTVKERERGYSESEVILALVYNLILGGSCLSDLNVLRGDSGTLSLLEIEQMIAPQTSGEFLRKFHIGEIWNLHRVQRILQEKIRPTQSNQSCTIDLDGSLYEQQSKGKQGSKKSYSGKYGYQPLFGFWAEEEELLFSHLLAGNRRADRKTIWFLQQTLKRIPTGVEIKLRADGEFYVWDVIEYCESKGIIYGISAQKREPLLNKIEAIDERKWKRSKYYKGAEVTELRYHPNRQIERRYIVKREQAVDKKGRRYYRYHCFVTNDEQTNADKLMKWQLGRCQAENLIKEHKSGFSLEKLPTRSYQANWAYLLIGGLAYNLVNWFKKQVLPNSYKRATVKTIRHRILNLAGKIVRTGRRYYLILSESYKYQKEWKYAIKQLEKLKPKSAYP